MADYFHDLMMVNELTGHTVEGKSLYARFGGRSFLERLNSVFYDKVYADLWLSQFFAGVDQKHIENQQSDFLAQLTGGPKQFSGRMPQGAHMHVMITEELFMLRHEMLHESLNELGLPEKEKAEFLKIDMAFIKILTKKSISECKPRYKMEELLDIPKPQRRAS
jgi:hemoglobin